MFDLIARFPPGRRRRWSGRWYALTFCPRTCSERRGGGGPHRELGLAESTRTSSSFLLDAFETELSRRSTLALNAPGGFEKYVTSFEMSFTTASSFAIVSLADVHGSSSSLRSRFNKDSYRAIPGGNERLRKYAKCASNGHCWKRTCSIVTQRGVLSCPPQLLRNVVFHNVFEDVRGGKKTSRTTGSPIRGSTENPLHSERTNVHRAPRMQERRRLSTSGIVEKALEHSDKTTKTSCYASVALGIAVFGLSSGTWWYVVVSAG